MLQTLKVTTPFGVKKTHKHGFFLNLAVITAGVIFIYIYTPAIPSGTPSPELPIPPKIGPISARKRSDLGKEGNTAVRVWSDPDKGPHRSSRNWTAGPGRSPGQAA